VADGTRQNVRTLVCVGKMVVRRLVRSGLQTLARVGSSSSWVTSLPSRAGDVWRSNGAGAGLAGAGHQHLVGTSRGESCSAAEKACISWGGGAVFGSRAFNGAALHKNNGEANDADGHSSSNGHIHGANGVSSVHSLNACAGSSKSPVASGAVSHKQQIRDPRQHARDVILGGAAALERLAATVDESFDRAVAMIEGRAPGSRVLVVGIGKSGHLARKMAATLSSTGTASFFMHGTEALHGDLGGAQAGDVAILLSNSGETEEVLQAAAGFRRARVSTIALTANNNNSLAATCDLYLCVGVHKELDHNGLAPTASAMATMALGDALAVVLSQRSDFSKRDFSLCHPAGQLGKIACSAKIASSSPLQE